jgi:hypothetical protein
MKTLFWNLGIAIIRIGYIIRDKRKWITVGQFILGVGYKIRGEVPQRTWKGNTIYKRIL